MENSAFSITILDFGSTLISSKALLRISTVQSQLTQSIYIFYLLEEFK